MKITSPQERLFYPVVFFSPSPASLFLECLALKRIIYQIIFIQVRKTKKKDGGGEKGPFAVLIAWRCTCENRAGLIKGTTAESLPLANENRHVTSRASSDGPDSASDHPATQCIAT